MTLKDLTEADWQKRRIEKPNVPEYALCRTKFTDKKANELQKSIVAWFKLSGYHAERISVTGRLIDQRKTYMDQGGKVRTIGSSKWIKTSMNVGSADVSATYKGRSVKVEVKIGKDTQSDDQKNYQESIEKAGGIYFIAKSWDSFINQIIKI